MFSKLKYSDRFASLVECHQFEMLFLQNAYSSTITKCASSANRYEDASLVLLKPKPFITESNCCHGSRAGRSIVKFQ